MKLLGDADEQIAQVMEVMNTNQVSHVHIETNGIGNFLPAMFRKAAAGKGLTCEGKPTSMNKIQKIMESYDTPLSGGLLHAHKSVMETPFRTQLRDFSAKSGRAKDDFIDAVAMAIKNQPIRIKTGMAGARLHDWASAVSGGSFEASMDALQF